MKIKVQVTHEDINLGEPLCSWNCPIARAIKRAGCKEVQVSDRIRFRLKGEYVQVDLKLNEEAMEFVKAFDAGKPVKPFEFEFELESWY